VRRRLFAIREQRSAAFIDLGLHSDWILSQKKDNASPFKGHFFSWCEGAKTILKIEQVIIFPY
jgi:hypothetical protein